MGGIEDTSAQLAYEVASGFLSSVRADDAQHAPADGHLPGVAVARTSGRPNAGPSALSRDPSREITHGLPTGSAAGAPLPRARAAVEPGEVLRVASQLFGRADPSTLSGYLRLHHPDLRHVYPPRLMQPNEATPPLPFLLAESVVNGWPLFLQGASLGVGASTLAADFARAFNTRAAAARDPRRVLYVRLLPRCRKPKDLLDAILTALHAPVTHTELRFRSNNSLVLRLFMTAVLARVAVIVVDHVANTTDDVRAFLGELLQVMDPTYHVPLDPADRLLASRVGLVLVDDQPPEVLFRQVPQALLGLRGRFGVLEPYTTVEQVGQALRLADVGMDDWDPADPDDLETAQLILQCTSGLVAQMNPFLSLLDRLSKRARVRPCPETVHAVLPYHREMVRLMSLPTIAADGSPGATFSTRAHRTPAARGGWRQVGGRGLQGPEAPGGTGAVPSSESPSAAADEPSADSGGAAERAAGNRTGGTRRSAGGASEAPRRLTRAERLEQTRKEREQATRTNAGIRRRAYTNLPGARSVKGAASRTGGTHAPE